MRILVTLLLLIISAKVFAAEQAKVGFFKLSHNIYESFCIIGIEGTITPLTATEFEEKLNNPSCKVLAPVVSIGASDGGDVEAALRIAELIKQKKLSTIIWPKPMDSHYRNDKQRCLSACALIFASGRNRHFPDVYSNQILGIHKPSFIQEREDKVQAEIDLDSLKYRFIKIFQGSNISPEFAISMFETRFEDMYYPDIRELSIWSVITSFDMPTSFTQPIRN